MNKTSMFANPLLVPNQSEMNHLNGLFKQSQPIKYCVPTGNTSHVQIKDFSSEALQTFHYKYCPRSKRRSFLEFQKNSFSLPKRQDNQHRSLIFDVDQDKEDSPRNLQNKKSQHRWQPLGLSNKQEYRKVVPIMAKKELIQKPMRLSTQTDKEDITREKKVKRLEKISIRPKSNQPKQAKNSRDKEKDHEEYQRSKSVIQIRKKQQKVKQQLNDFLGLREYVLNMDFVQNLLANQDIDEQQLFQIISSHSFQLGCLFSLIFVLEMRIFLETLKDGSKMEKKIRKYVARKILREKEMNEIEVKYSVSKKKRINQCRP